ncbi:MAG: cytochrome c family protein [Hyphomonadaceae bacterium]|nr:cytochrome c family protein [Hyphomonadaceae bacterium]MBC6411557.1 cytochrome c family protein [Hyphomonadaceae bacterium]
MSGDLEFNKIAAAVLATSLGYMLLREIPHFLIRVEKPEKPAYALEIIEPAGPGEEEVELPFPQAEWVAAMVEADGVRVFRKCASCHNAEEDGDHSTGPNLWDIVGTAAAGKDGFNYSASLVNSGIVWDYETLDAYLERPSRRVSGTAMNFIGLKKPEDRAAVIEYMRVRSVSPPPKPEPVVVGTPESAEPDAVVTADDTQNPSHEAEEAAEGKPAEE